MLILPSRDLFLRNAYLVQNRFAILPNRTWEGEAPAELQARIGICLDSRLGRGLALLFFKKAITPGWGPNRKGSACQLLTICQERKENLPEE